MQNYFTLLRRYWIAITVLCLLGGCGGGSSTGSTANPFSGFQVDLSALSAEQKVITTANCITQIQVIQGANLPPEMYAFMKTVPIVADPTSSGSALFSTTGGRDKGLVTVTMNDMPATKPILLHEMLHAYDWNYWRFAKTDITSAYADAMNNTLYPESAGSHFLSNAKEYFAVSGTVYLVSPIEQKPYNCTQLALLQPDYVAFLESIFGKHHHCN